MSNWEEAVEHMKNKPRPVAPKRTVQEVNNQSCQYCGCDPGANHLCETHRLLTPQQDPSPISPTASVPTAAVSEQESQRRTAVKAYHEAPVNRHWTPLNGIKDSGERVTYASGSMRDPSTGKIKWSRITFGPMMRRWAQHLTSAEAKYPDPQPGVPNFMLIETEEERIRYKESALRHFMSWFHEETDEDHAAAVFFNINGVAIIDDKRKEKA